MTLHKYCDWNHNSHCKHEKHFFNFVTALMIYTLAKSLGIGSYLVKMITIFWVEWFYVSEEFVAGTICMLKFISFLKVPMVTTESGLQYKDIKVGQGPSPPVGFQVCNNFVIWELVFIFNLDTYWIVFFCSSKPFNGFLITLMFIC